MSEPLVACGSWRLRHGDVTGENDRQLALYPAPGGYESSARSVRLDLRGKAQPRYLCEPGSFRRVGPREGAEENTANLAPDRLPLGLLSLDGERLELTHLLTRIEPHVSHFLSLDGYPREVAPDALDRDLRQGFAEGHLELNNFEGFYTKGLTDIELEQKYNIDSAYDYFEVTRRFYAKLDDGEVGGFQPQLGDEIEPWSYDNDFCQIAPNPEGVGGYVSVMHWSRKEKTSWDEGVVTYKKKLFDRDTLERWERNYHEQEVSDDPAAALSAFFSLPLKRLPSWRRTRFDIAAEASHSGNVFMVNFEDSRVREDRAPGHGLQQCEIEYLKTRGEPDEETIYSDLRALCAEVERFMHGCGLDFDRTNYSKLTFLNEYVERTGSQSPSPA